MHIRYIEVCNFRALKNQRIEFPRRITFVIGKNGEGKTTLLEAIYLLSQAKSFRKAKPSDLIKWENSEDNIDTSLKESITSTTGLISSVEGSKTLVYEVVDGKRRVLVNGSTVTDPRCFYGQLIALDFTPSDLSLVAGPPAVRRQFIDRLLVMLDRSFVDVLVQYHRALKQRNALLISLSRNKAKLSALDKQSLLMWTPTLVNNGLEIAKRRVQACYEIEHHMRNYYDILIKNDCGIKNAEEVTLRYSSKIMQGNELLETDEVSKKYENTIDQDLRYHKTTYGVHHDEIVVYLDTGYGLKEARYNASQGQLKSLALALKLAGIEVIKERTGETPVLLLDDVESELDSDRREAFFKMISESDSQVIITATDVSRTAQKYLKEMELKVLEKGLLI